MTDLNLIEDITLTYEQEECIDNIVKYLVHHKDNNKYDKKINPFSVDGFAGTGKTTIISYISKLIKDNHKRLKLTYRNIAFLTFTGKASSVLKSKLEKQKVVHKDYDYIGTIHSFLYVPILEYDPTTKVKKIVGWKKRESLESQDLIIIDESSMVNTEILEDLFSLNVPIVMFGDSFQLQPVSGKENPYLYNCDYKLREIHRQALDNPIIYLSKFVRENLYMPKGIFSKNVFKLHWDNQKTKDLFYNIDFSNVDNINETVVLSGYNQTRIHINKLIRKKLGYSANMPICTNEKVICLHNNSVVSNGQIGIVMFELFKPVYNMWKVLVKFDNDFMYEFYCPEKIFNKSHKFNIFDEIKILNKKYKRIKISCIDYAYCITVHKSQGSEFDRVVLFEERFPQIDDYSFGRWLYTGITRAKEKLFIIEK